MSLLPAYIAVFALCISAKVEPMAARFNHELPLETGKSGRNIPQILKNPSDEMLASYEEIENLDEYENYDLEEEDVEDEFYEDDDEDDEEFDDEEEDEDEFSYADILSRLSSIGEKLVKHKAGEEAYNAAKQGGFTGYLTAGVPGAALGGIINGGRAFMKNGGMEIFEDDEGDDDWE